MNIEKLGDISVCIRDEKRKLIAFGSLDTKTGEILGVYTDPSYRKKGLATQIIIRLRDIALQELYLSEVFATVNENERQVNHLFEKLGFKRWNKWLLRNPNMSGNIDI